SRTLTPWPPLPCVPLPPAPNGRGGTPASGAARGELGDHQVVEEVDQVFLLIQGQAFEVAPAGGPLAAVLQDRFGQRRGAAVVQVRRGRADAPEVAGEEHRRPGPRL